MAGLHFEGHHHHPRKQLHQDGGDFIGDLDEQADNLLGAIIWHPCRGRSIAATSESNEYGIQTEIPVHSITNAIFIIHMRI